MNKLTRYLLLGLVALLCSGYAWADPVTVSFESLYGQGTAGANFHINYVSGSYPTWAATVTAQFVTGNYNYVLDITTATGTVTEVVTGSGASTFTTYSGSFGPGGMWQLYGAGQLLSSGILSSAFVYSDHVLGDIPPYYHDSFSAVLIGTYGNNQVSMYTNYASIHDVSGSVTYDSSTVTPVPEPTSIALLGSGVLALGRTVKRRLAAKKQADCASS